MSTFPPTHPPPPLFHALPLAKKKAGSHISFFDVRSPMPLVGFQPYNNSMYDAKLSLHNVAVPASRERIIRTSS